MFVGITERGDAGLDLQRWLEVYKKSITLDFVIAITKAPSILWENRDILPRNLIIHATITGWGGLSMEPNVKAWHVELEAYNNLVNHFGPDKVVLRIDPIIPIPEGVDAAVGLSTYCKGRLRISILDLYGNCQDRMTLDKVAFFPRLKALYGETLHLNSQLRFEILSKFPNAEICGEPGFKSVGCVSELDYKALGLPVPINNFKTKQRPSCSCLAQKKELLSNKHQCKHGCLYCYWK